MSVFYSENIQNGIIVFDGEESNHIIKALRMRIGDEIEVINGRGSIFTANIDMIDKKQVVARVMGESKLPLYHKSHHIAIAPTKNVDRIEWFIEKAVEIGIGGIHLMQTKRTERARINKDRCLKIIKSAMKQSRNIYQPEFTTEIKFEEIIKKEMKGNKYIAHVNNEATQLGNIDTIPQNSILLIGPEGDFTSEEITKAKSLGYDEVSLGKSVLRTETAGIQGLVTLNLKSKI